MPLSKAQQLEDYVVRLLTGDLKESMTIDLETDYPKQAMYRARAGAMRTINSSPALQSSHQFDIGCAYEGSLVAMTPYPIHQPKLKVLKGGDK